jgi:hypothetical protein
MNCAFNSPLGKYKLIMPRFFRLRLYARALVTRYSVFSRLRASPCLSLALYGIIATCFLMIAQFYLNRD